MPFVLLRRIAPGLIGGVDVAFVGARRFARRIVRWVFFPVIKWWEVAKEAIGDRDWFLLLIWCLPGLLLYVIYSPIVLFLLGVLCDIVIWALEFPYSLIEWLKGVIQ